ncbi:hypothetical protein DQ384_11930 [Sphaerisporangium album]|uniref:Uncharacterized protein n=1 Tax=Sphaerisporangium album TaxID=509200 RepID=A0A367FLY7_9ACTN|nr:DUF6113 family protein [Sphaerisporangium album]RCG31408.1 hypothetical protein DQ384_11930 [Sphaerisporangium album]
MEEEQVEAGTRPASGALSGLVTGVVYGLLFVFGVVYGVVAGLEHSWPLGDVVAPIPIVLALALFGLLYGAGRLMSSKLGAFVPGMGWMFAALVFSMKRPEGDLVIAANAPGYYYLVSGAVALVTAVLLIPSSGSWLLRQGPYGKAGHVNVSGGMSA